jgi:hypothetical protein
MTRFAALLRRLADRMDPQSCASVEAPTPASDEEEFGPQEYGSLSEVRERQEERLRELQYLIDRTRDHDPDSGLIWFESWQLRLIRKILDHELDLRERHLGELLDRGRRGA